MDRLRPDVSLNVYTALLLGNLHKYCRKWYTWYTAKN